MAIDNPQEIRYDDEALELVKSALLVARLRQGEVFGDFVRDVIIPREIDPKCEVTWKDVDIWFKSQADLDKFVRDKGLTLIGTGTDSADTFKRVRYMLKCSHGNAPYIDTIVSKEFPVNDFDVNLLRYSCHMDGKFELVGVGNTSAKRCDPNVIVAIKSSIIEKRATMLPEYASFNYGDIIVDKPNFLRLERIYTRFMLRGWNIFVPNKPYPINIFFEKEISGRCGFDEPIGFKLRRAIMSDNIISPVSMVQMKMDEVLDEVNKLHPKDRSRTISDLRLRLSVFESVSNRN